MARQPDIQYVHYYTQGSAARKFELPEKKNKVGLPREQVRREKKQAATLKPIYACAMFVAGVLLLTMVIGMIKLGVTNAETARMESYVDELYAENARLRKEYKDSYDLDEIKQQALKMGLVPIDQVEHIAIDVVIPEADPEPTFWEKLGSFWTELFA